MRKRAFSSLNSARQKRQEEFPRLVVLHDVLEFDRVAQPANVYLGQRNWRIANDAVAHIPPST